MIPERVLDHPALVLDQRARMRYFEDGFLTLPGYVAPAWLDRLLPNVSLEGSRTTTEVEPEPEPVTVTV